MKAVRLAFMPLMLAGMLGSATAAYAARYIEVWNPPEARAHPPAHHLAPVRSHGSGRPLARKVTQPDGPSSERRATQRTAVRNTDRTAGTAALTAASSKHRAVLAWPPAIPRQLGPDGRALQV